MTEARSVHLDQVPLATLIPQSSYFVLTERSIAPERKYVLSRFAYTHKEENETLLECPLSYARIVLHHWIGSAIVHILMRPSSVQDLCSAIPDLPDSSAKEMMNLLFVSGMLSEAEDDEITSLQSWEFHDLLFHSRSRGGRHDHPAGGTYRFLGRFDMPRVLKEIKSGESFPLHKPDLEKLQREDPPYALVQEERSSIREYSSQPISSSQLGEFLHRVGRVADFFKTGFNTVQGLFEMEFAPRPYPAAGALYELELYVVINRCENLDSGLYYYDPEKHRLIRIAERTPDVESLLKEASRATTVPFEQIQTMIIITARFQRLAWKYYTMAYAAILKNVGVVMQTMYLAATAMGLAPCAIGYGDSDLFAKAAGTEYYSETSIGEFLLGSKPSSDGT